MNQIGFIDYEKYNGKGRPRLDQYITDPAVIFKLLTLHSAIVEEQREFGALLKFD